MERPQKDKISLGRRAADVRGLVRLLTDATTRTTDVVEAVHDEVTSLPFAPDPRARTRGLTALVYGAVRGVTGIVGGALDRSLGLALGLLAPDPDPNAPGEQAVPNQEVPVERGALVAALNGVVGDYLAATQNPLAIEAALRRHGRDSPGSATAAAPVTGKVVVLAHGLCMSSQQWRRGDHDHGEALARDLGFTPLYLSYNSGLHVSENGRALAELLEQTLAGWPVPVEQLAIVGHSMGGLVARSAGHAAARAGHRWPHKLRTLVFVGTPHHGAPLERGGNWIDVILGAAPYTAAIGRLGRLRSAGITDLRYGLLRDADWRGQDRFARTPDQRRPLPLPPGVRCFALAATLGAPTDHRRNRLFGDGLVPLPSALGHHERPERDLGIPEAHQWIGYRMSHMDLLDRPEVYARLREAIADPA